LGGKEEKGGKEKENIMIKSIFPRDFMKFFFAGLTAIFILSGFFIIAPPVLAVDEDNGPDIGEPIDPPLEEIIVPTVTPVRVVLTGDKTDIDADGIEFATISAQLKDADGNNALVAGIPITFFTNRGVISPTTAVDTDANGVSVAILTSGDDRVGGMTNIYATSEGLAVAGVSVVIHDITPPDAPVIAIPASSPVVISIANKNSQTLSGVAEADSIVEIYVNNLASTVWTKAVGGTFAFTNDNLRAYGAEIVSDADYSVVKTVVVKATDMGGNQSAQSNAIYYIQDTVAPLTYDENTEDEDGSEVDDAVSNEPTVDNEPIVNDEPIVESEPIIIADVSLPPSDSDECGGGTIEGGAIIVAGGGIDPNWNLIFSSDTMLTSPTAEDGNDQEVSDVDIAGEEVAVPAIPVVSIALVVPPQKQLPVVKSQPKEMQDIPDEKMFSNETQELSPVGVASVAPEEKTEQKSVSLLASMANTLSFGTGNLWLLIVLMLLFLIILILALAVLYLLKKLRENQIYQTELNSK
jgi:hypothetical protein